MSRKIMIESKYSNYTVIELKKLAKERDIKGYSSMRKAELCFVLDNWNVANYDNSYHKDNVACDKILQFPPLKSILKKSKYVPSKQTSNKTISYPIFDIDRVKYAKRANKELEKEKKELVSRKIPIKIRFSKTISETIMSRQNF